MAMKAKKVLIGKDMGRLTSIEGEIWISGWRDITLLKVVKGSTVFDATGMLEVRGGEALEEDLELHTHDSNIYLVVMDRE